MNVSISVIHSGGQGGGMQDGMCWASVIQSVNKGLIAEVAAILVGQAANLAGCVSAT